MVVACPRCKTKLKVDDTKLSPQGSRFKCPKCSTTLIVKKPVVQQKKALYDKKVLVAHSNPSVAETARKVLERERYEVITSADGIDAMIRALKEFPSIGIIEVALPKIYGFEVCKRLKARSETRDMKLILMPSIHDKTKYRREPMSLYGADEYIEEQDVPTRLIEIINNVKGAAPTEAEKPLQQPSGASVQPSPEKKAELPPKQSAPPPPRPAADEKGGEFIEKAKRLARTIINDIYLYNATKVDEAIRRGEFYTVFAAEVREGRKLFDSRIPQETRNKFDYYNEAIENFLSAKKSSLG